MKPIKLKSGKYRLSKQVNNIRKYFYGDTAKECKQKYDKYNGNFSSADVPFKIGFKNYLDEYVSTLSKASQVQYETLAAYYILPVIGSIQLSRILPFNVQIVLSHARNKNGGYLSESTLKHIKKIMHSYFEFERKMKKSIKENPCEDIVIPKVPRTRERRAANIEELSIIWERMKYTHYFYCFQFLLLTGIRPSEVCGLKYSDIKSNKIKISETRSRHDVSDGKTKNANRIIDLTPAMIDIINSNKISLSKHKIESEYIFPTRDGFASNSAYLSRAWGRLLEGSDIHLTLYELRHTFISLMIDKLPLKDLQKIVGHSSRMDTSTVYAHAFNKDNNNSEIIDETITKYLPKSVL